ncbi:hypothetical protein BCR39DRAFT_133709 [Naematelia encephala]|uniref:Uncharacterized protein n=1 Tax=Naematelia encephala TaxID=71784 RepID=A0A1Y2BJ98_9TREE|nr:hypothetical protein BCR39DRAFT_133709 [Naematelia encephala]
MSNPEARRHKLSHPAKLKGKESPEGPVPSARSSSLIHTRRSSLPPTASNQSPSSSPRSNIVPDPSATYQSASFASKSLIELRASVPAQSPTLSFRTLPPVQRRALNPGTASTLSDYSLHGTSTGHEFTEQVDETQLAILYTQLQSREAKRRYRQSLVDIQDDWVFQREARNLVKLESTDVAEWQGRRAGSGDSVGAWFVTRELVQGERRHGRILSKGVEMVRAAAAAARVRDDVPTASRIESSVSKSSIRLRRQRTAPGSSRAKSEQRHETSRSEETAVIPLDILLFRLPRLLALSLTLSTRFDHDPSPAGVATAFSEMESNLTSEIGLWAGEIGSIVTTGLGRTIGKSMQSGGADKNDPRGEDRDDRLILGDIADYNADTKSSKVQTSLPRNDRPAT